MKVRFVRPAAPYEPYLLNQVYEVVDWREDSNRIWVKGKNAGTFWFYKEEIVKSP